MITKEEREEWREEAVDEQSIWINRQAGRILRLLDALDEAEAKMYEMDLHTGGARVVQCKSCQEAEARAEKAERERDWIANKMTDISTRMNAGCSPETSFCRACNICPLEGDSDLEGYTCWHAIMDAAQEAAK